LPDKSKSIHHEGREEHEEVLGKSLLNDLLRALRVLRGEKLFDCPDGRIAEV
jgi:hypothetical protein